VAISSAEDLNSFVPLTADLVALVEEVEAEVEAEEVEKELTLRRQFRLAEKNGVL